jgi:tetratricopeptide (TPR) repeat protein
VSEHVGDLGSVAAYKAAIGPRVFTDLPDPWVDELSSVCYDAYLLSVAASTANFGGQQAAALEMINRAIGLAPDASTYRRQAGQYLLQSQDFAGARVHLAKAVELNPTDSESWLRYLDALHGLGQNREYITALRAALANCPQSSGLHLEYARWLKASDRVDGAIAEFRYAYELRPSEAAPLIELATTYLSAGRSDDAIDALKEALQRQPDHPMALGTLAYIAITKNDEAEARRWFEQFRKQSRSPPEFTTKLQQAFQQQFGHSLP